MPGQPAAIRERSASAGVAAPAPPWLAGWLPLFLLLALLLATRGLLVLSLADAFLLGEELQKGAAGKALLDRLPLPWHALAFHPYEGGGFVVSHLDALAFLAVGQSLLALKLVAFALDALILVLGWRFARWAFGPGAAVVFGLLHVLAPESLQKQALLALGIHYQALPFVLLVLHLGARVAFERDLRPRTLALLGFAAGFGIYFSYQVALAVGFAGLVVLALRREALLGRPALWAWGGLVVGLLPLMWMAAHVGGAVLDVHGTPLIGGGGLGARAQVLWSFLVSVLGDRPLAVQAALWARPLLVVAGLGLALRATGSRARRCALLIGGYLAFFLLVYSASSFAVGEVYHHFLFHRLSPAWTLGALLVAAGAGAALARGRAWRAGAMAAVGLLVAIGAADAWSAAREGNPSAWRENLDLVARTKGYAYRGYLAKIARDLQGPPADALAVALHFREPDPALLQRTAAQVLLLDPELSFPQVREAIAAVGGGDAYWLGLGPWLQLRLGGGVVERVAAVRDLPEAELLTAAIGRFGSVFPPTLEEWSADLREGLEHGLPPAYFRGLGGNLYEVRGERRVQRYWQHRGAPFALAPQACERVLAAQGPAVQALLREGYRAALAEHTLP